MAITVPQKFTWGALKSSFTNHIWTKLAVSHVRLCTEQKLTMGALMVTCSVLVGGLEML